MSIIIKGMDMPKDCSYCILANEHINGLCEKKYYCRLEADYEHCPLIEIDLVRCGECKHRKKNGFCLEHNRYEKNDKGYCSYGERRNDEHTD